MSQRRRICDFRFLFRRCYSKLSNRRPESGIIFDIDGVIARGRNVLPAAIGAFKDLRAENDTLKMPVVFVTNAGNCLRREKSRQLSEWLGFKVEEEQVVLSHSPLKFFKNYHKFHTLLSGQGPVKLIAENLGFSNYTTIDDIRHDFPLLDAVDLQRRNVKDTTHLQKSRPIEAVLLLGEPVRWETSLQLIIDALLTNGYQQMPPRQLLYPHIPVLACNMDLQWMSEASMPRFGHGTFLLCLEELYKKICGVPLQYTAAVGKPSEITFHTAFCLLMLQAKKWNSYPRRLYVIGDNICTDIYGGNLYDKFLKTKSSATPSGNALQKLIQDNNSMNFFPDTCTTMLVETGVYSQDDYLHLNQLHHSPRDFKPTTEDLAPKFILKDIREAVSAILSIEKVN